MIARLLSATAVLLVLAACGSDPSSTPAVTEPPTTEPSVDVVLPDNANAIVLQVDVGVNQPDSVSISTGYPFFTLYRDGRLIVRDPEIATGPLPPLVIAQLTPDGVDALVAEAIAAGALDPLERYGSPNIADDDSYRFVVATAERQSDFGVYGLGHERDENDEITDEQLAARIELLDLRNRLLGWQDTVAGEIAEPPVPFTGETMLVMAYSEIDAANADFPFDLTTNGETYENRVNTVFCTELVVAESPGLIEIVTAPNDPRTTGLEFRQSLPHEPGCEIMPDQ